MSVRLAEHACTGCTACAASCPKQCITMQWDAEGFLHPRIDASACVACGLCEKTCPVLNPPAQPITETRAYAAYAKDEALRLASSSGGLFSLLANNVLDDGGIVYGAAFDEHFDVRHTCIETKDELDKLRGSKYVQSDPGHIFTSVKQELERGREVLFSGTICQIAGLRAYLKKDYPNLLAVDVLCHGAPSPKLWRKYLDEMESAHGAAVRRVFFRHKKYGWKTYALSLEFTNGEAYVRVFNQDPYMRMFLNNICLRPSCYDCRFNALNRVSDITLGDCWGIHGVMPDMDDDRGTSVVLVHTEKGNDCFEKVKQGLVFREAEVDCILPPGSGGRTSVTPHPRRTRFFDLLNQGASFSEFTDLLEPGLWERIISLIRRTIQKALRILNIR